VKKPQSNRSIQCDEGSATGLLFDVNSIPERDRKHRFSTLVGNINPVGELKVTMPNLVGHKFASPFDRLKASGRNVGQLKTFIVVSDNVVIDMEVVSRHERLHRE
jgi:hypothetical protein